jgi:hypothetical protein
MRRFLIKSNRFDGTAELNYNDSETLCLIDCTKTNMNAETVYAFKKAVPVTIAILLENKAFAAGTHIIESDFEISQSDFEREYPYSRNYHLLDDLWPKIKKADQVKAYFSAIEYRKYCDRNKDWYKPRIAEAWLKKREYLNDWRKM